MTTIKVEAGTVQVRRISWAEFWKLRPDRRPANDAGEAQKDAA
jgi:hypothetical protein